MDYRSAGVNILEADKLVKWLKSKVRTQFTDYSHQKKSSTVRQRGDQYNNRRKFRKQKKTIDLKNNIGAYSGLFPVHFPGMKDPYLAASTDGVGTKLQLAEYFQSYKEVGQDLVAMCVNDIICCGAHPLFFLDYYACSRLRQKSAREFLSGVLSACKKSSCILLGGETAEMPGTYMKSHFDCAGFTVGVVDRSALLGSHKVKAGDLLLGVSSTGFHSNGFSLLRKVFKLRQWKRKLLKPTALYVPLAKSLFPIKGLKAMAHITGGGIDNIQRIIPKGLVTQIKPWNIPDIFLEVQKKARITRSTLLKTFNCGVGLVLVISPSSYQKISRIIVQHGFSAIDLGEVINK